MWKQIKSNLTSRKLWFAWSIFITLTVFLSCGSISNESYVSIMTILIPAYIIGNVGEHYSNSVATRNQRTPQASNNDDIDRSM
jgi:hypothetical protein